jgi:tetratricopeptide (TPR) repeat protein
MRRVAVGLALVLGAAPMMAQHTDPMNLDPQVRQAFEKFYNLDFDGALHIWNGVAQAHPQSAMAWNYILVGTMFRELYRQDLLDTTYYAHDSFLMNKRAVNIAPGVRQQIEDLTNRVIGMTDAAIKNNPNDKNALFARGYAKGMHAAFITLVDHSYGAAARQGLQAKNDSEAVLKIDPQYADADMAIGIQQYAVASLPRIIRFMVGVFGVGGNKERGIALLREAAAHGVVTSVEARTALSLFLRHDGRYREALDVERSLTAQYPHDYLFRLEVANLLKDEGQGYLAMDEYKKVQADGVKPGYFIEPRLQLGYFGWADTQRGYNDIKGAAMNYAQAAEQPNCSDWMRKRAALNAGEMFDKLGDRQEALRYYRIAAAPGGDQSQASEARKYLNTPFTGR